jgi:3'-5' exoribonuclease
MVEDAMRKVPGFPPALRDLVVHMILSHHGALEFGSPKLPMFLEAMLLHQLDNLDSKMECMRAHAEKDRQTTGVWTGYNAPLERSVLKKERHLAGEAAVEAHGPAPSEAEPARPPGNSSLLASRLQDALRRDS